MRFAARCLSLIVIGCTSSCAEPSAVADLAPEVGCEFQGGRTVMVATTAKVVAPVGATILVDVPACSHPDPYDVDRMERSSPSTIDCGAWDALPRAEGCKRGNGAASEIQLTRRDGFTALSNIRGPVSCGAQLTLLSDKGVRLGAEGVQQRLYQCAAP